MEYIGSGINVTATGYGQHLKKYQAKNCEGWPLRGVCHKAQGNLIIEANHNLNRLKQIAKERLNSEAGVAHRKQRCHDVEPVFGNIKGNHGFRRFIPKGKQKVAVGFGLLALAQNIRKKAAKRAEKALLKSCFTTLYRPSSPITQHYHAFSG